MRIKKLHLENFRGFENLDIEFPQDSNVTVFIGENGSGKSSLLDAIMINLGVFVEKFKSELTDDDINIKAKSKEKDIDSFENELKNKIEVQQHYSFIFEDSNSPNNSQLPFSWATEKELGSGGTITVLENNISIERYKEILYTKRERWEKDYVFNHFKLRQDIDDINKSFENFSLWFEREAKLENEIRLEKDINFREPILEFLRTTIQTYFSYLDKNIRFSNLNVKTERVTLNKFANNFESQIESYLKIDKNGETFKLSQLSSGEKSILLLVFELAQEVISLSTQDRINRFFQQGIVLIDEIELHLHPKWQRNIVPALTKTFPNIQFIITTHSPQVLSYVPNGSAFSIENGKVYPVNTYGRDNEWILETIMNDIARPKEIQAELDKLFDLIRTDKISEARLLRKQIATMIGDNEAELLKADILIQRKTRALQHETH